MFNQVKDSGGVSIISYVQYRKLNKPYYKVRIIRRVKSPKDIFQNGIMPSIANKRDTCVLFYLSIMPLRRPCIAKAKFKAEKNYKLGYVLQAVQGEE